VTGPGAQPLTVVATVAAGTAVVVISGELDLMTMPSLAGHLARILDMKPQRLIFDMSRVGFLDCFAARLLVSTGQFLPDGRAVIRRPGPVVRRILELTGLHAQCEVEE
jgi:anti-anti-sigma factor